VLVAKMAVRAKRQDIKGNVIYGVFVNVVQLRTVTTADSATVTIFLQNLFLDGFWDVFPLLRDSPLSGLSG